MKHFHVLLLVFFLVSNSVLAQQHLQKRIPVRRSPKKIATQLEPIRNPEQTTSSDDKTKPITEDDLFDASLSYNRNLKPYCYAHLKADGSVEKNPTTFRIQTAREGEGRYLIYLGSTDNTREYIVSATMTGSPGFITIKKEDGEFTANTYSMSGRLSNKSFDFVVYSIIKEQEKK